MPVLYPSALPNVPSASNGHPRLDLQVILLTGIPPGILPNFRNDTGPVLADLLRLNMAIPPSANPNRLGIVAGLLGNGQSPDLAGFPNGRRPLDDTIDIYLKVAAGVTYPLVNPSFTPDAAAALLSDGVDEPVAPFLNHFPYLPQPFNGYKYPNI